MKKFASESLSIMSELVLPNDTNTLNSMIGGKLLLHMDIIAGIAAQRHCNYTVVTASVDNVYFKKPILLGNVVTLKAKVSRAFTTSMEVHIEVFSENLRERTSYKTNEAFYTMVAVDESRIPVTVPELIPETEKEKKLFEQALKRRQLRLILSGRMKPSDANDLKDLFLST